MKKLLTLSIAALALMAFMAAPTFACGEKAENAKTASAEKSCASKATDAKMASAKEKSCDGAKATMASADKKECASKTDAKMTSAEGKTCSASKASMASADKKECASKATLTGADCASKASMTDAQKEACAAACASKSASMAKYMTEEQCKTLCAPYGENATVRMVSIEGMTCGGCENAIKTALTEMEGVHKVAKVCHEAGFALVVVDKNVVKDDILTRTVSNKGFKAEIIPAAATMTADKAEGATCSGTKKAEGTSAGAH